MAARGDQSIGRPADAGGGATLQTYGLKTGSLQRGDLYDFGSNIMKKLVTLVALASLFAAPALASVPDEGPDSYGIYYLVGDEYVNQVFDVGPNTFVPTYVVLAGISRPSVGGWEVAFDFTAGSGAVVGTIYTGEASNFAGVPSFIVGLGTPLPTPAEGYLVLAEMNMLFFGGVQEWYGGPTTPASIAGVPAYANGEDVSDLVPCVFSTDADGMFTDDEGWMTIPLAAINMEAPVATENASWSNVKNLYR
jgi:hypothetical protein